MAGALVAIVLVLCAVFVPVAFLGGVTGEMSKQFAVTIVIAVVLSGIVALTLTPALCALLLKETPHETHTTGFFGWFNRWFDRVTGGYVGAVGRVLGRPRAWLAAFVRDRWCWRSCSDRRVPDARSSRRRTRATSRSRCSSPTRASLQRTDAVVERVEGDPAGGAGGARTSSALVGLDILTQVEPDERRHDLRAC